MSFLPHENHNVYPRASIDRSIGFSLACPKEVLHVTLIKKWVGLLLDLPRRNNAC
jgi:hypothetical protein